MNGILPSVLSLETVGKVVGRIRPPGSKSLTNRAVTCAALAEGTSVLDGVLESEDTLVMVEAWRQLGWRIDWDRRGHRMTVEGGGGTLPPGASQGEDGQTHSIYVANSGTTLRFLTAALATFPGNYLLSGVPRMHQRPVGDLLEALRKLGVDARSSNLERPDCPPVTLAGNGMEGGTTQVAGSISSQFLSGLLMAAPNARGPVQIDVEGELVSRSYVEMTWRVMERFGVQVERRSERSFVVPAPQRYRACRYEIEPDASAASYFFAVAAITDGDVLVEGVRRDGLQGDAGFVDVLQAMGCQVDQLPDGLRVRGTGKLRGVDIDMNTMSDTVQTLAMVALFAEGPTRVRGVAHNRHKETDRIGDLATELRKLGAEVIEHSDGMTIVPGVLRPATLETYNDHRMAMSFALAALRVPGIRIVHPICIEKTYPNFFADLSRLTGSRWSDASQP